MIALVLEDDPEPSSTSIKGSIKTDPVRSEFHTRSTTRKEILKHKYKQQDNFFCRRFEAVTLGCFCRGRRRGESFHQFVCVVLEDFIFAASGIVLFQIGNLFKQLGSFGIV